MGKRETIVAKDNNGKEYTIKNGKLYNSDGSEYIVEDYNDVIRPLNEAEYGIYASAVLYATKILPSFRDAVNVLRPFFDLSCRTAYTDSNARCGLGPWFFSDQIDGRIRASVLLHESMHVLNDHFVRFENYGSKTSNQLMNIAGDFEINCALRDTAMVNLDFAIFPDEAPYDFKKNLLMEQYIELLQEDENICSNCGSKKDNQNSNNQNSNSSSSSGSNSENSSDSSSNSDGESGSKNGSDDNSNDSDNSGSENNSDDNKDTCSNCGGKETKKDKWEEGCGSSSDAKEEAADNKGIEKASEVEQNISKRNTAVRIAEEIDRAKRAGDGHLANFFERVLFILRPPKVNWRQIFNKMLSSSANSAIKGNQDYSYTRVNRRLINSSKYIFPGMVKYQPRAMFGIDTSGSMGKNDYENLLIEIESIIKKTLRGKNSTKIFTVDTEISNIQTVSSVKDINLVGGGGTRMATAFEYINSLSKREIPDIFVLSTDAYLARGDWYDIIKAITEAPKRYRPIILVTSKNGMKEVPEEMFLYAKVVDISE